MRDLLTNLHFRVDADLWAAVEMTDNGKKNASLSQTCQIFRRTVEVDLNISPQNISARCNDFPRLSLWNVIVFLRFILGFI